MKSLTKCYFLKAFIAKNISRRITYIDHHGKEASYNVIGINDLYSNINMIVAPTALIYSGWYYY